jgi:hypothetical protein
MANLKATSSPNVTASNIQSPIVINSGSYAMIEYSGNVFLGLNGQVDLITNNSGYVRMTGFGYFSSITNNSARSFGHFSFGVSRYGVLYTDLISSGSYSLSNYQSPTNVDVNSLRFNNTYDSGTFYFSLVIQNVTSASSTVLTRIK